VHVYTWVPIQYPVRDQQRAGWGKVPINTRLVKACCWSLITAAVACLGARFTTRVPIQYPVRDFASGVRLGGRSQSILTCQACCWSLITAAVACLGALYTWVPIQHPVRVSATAGLLGARSNNNLTSLLLVPDNSSCCLPGPSTQGPNPVSC
jgi:hypothetical protein